MGQARAIADDLVELEAQAEAGEPTDELIERLNARIREFLASGYSIAWIEAEHDALVRLFLEGGEDVVALDPDPTVDAAWYGQFRLRAGSREGVWVYRKGRFGQISGHAVS